MVAVGDILFVEHAPTGRGLVLEIIASGGPACALAFEVARWQRAAAILSDFRTSGHGLKMTRRGNGLNQVFTVGASFVRSCRRLDPWTNKNDNNDATGDDEGDADAI